MSDQDRPGQRVFVVGQKVRFTERHLMAHPEKAKRFAGRTGNVIGYRMGAVEPIVEFPRDGCRKEARLFEQPIETLQAVD